MKRTDLKNCDIVVCDYSWFGRPTVYYVVIGEYMISFDGDVNCGERPMGWYYTHETGSNDNELPMECVKVYRPKHITHTFNGDFDNEEYYECIYEKID